jgi:hypothetical protein
LVEAITGGNAPEVGVNHNRKIGSAQCASQSVKTCRMVKMPMTQNDRFDIFRRNVQRMHICNKAIWRCARVIEETVCLSSNSERHQSAKAMLRKWALKGFPPFHQRCCDAEFLAAQACSLCDALIRKQAVKNVISQDRNCD